MELACIEYFSHYYFRSLDYVYLLHYLDYHSEVNSVCDCHYYCHTVCSHSYHIISIDSSYVVLVDILDIIAFHKVIV